MFLSDILRQVATHPQAAYFLIFLISLSESLAFVGLLIPGTVLMFTVGAVISTGSLSLKPALIVATAGAIAGDGISYWLGRHYHQRLKILWPFNRHPQILVRGEAFFRRHGGKSILFGRFVGPVRPVIPIVAGMMDLQPLRFTLVNILSAIGWAIAYIIPGVFFGTSLAMAGSVSTRLSVLVLFVLGTILVAVWFMRKLVFFVEHFGPKWISLLETWIASSTTVHGVMIPLKRFLLFLFSRQKGEEFLLSFLVLVVFLTGWGFLGVLQDVIMRDSLVRADRAVYHLLQSLRNPWGDYIFVTITELGDGLINFFVGGAVFLTLLFKRCYRTAGYWLTTLIAGVFLIRSLKWTLHLPRPVVLYHGISAFGFPSGHTAMSIVLYGFLALIIAKGLRSALRWSLFVTVFLISFSIAFSRLYLGVHWFSDVLGGFLLASLWTAIAGIFYLKGRPEIIPRRIVGVVTLVVFFTVGPCHVAGQHSKDLAFYTPRHSVKMMTLQTWLKNGWEGLPGWRIDLGGERKQPLTIQWAGSPEGLAQYLVSKGWHFPSALNLKIFLGMLLPEIRVQDLPVLPHLHEGRFERVLLVKEKGNRRWVFRLWPTDIQLKEGSKLLWVGTIETQVEYRVAGLITVAKDESDYTQSVNYMSQTLKQNFRIREKYRKNDIIHRYRKRHDVMWDGRLLLAMEPVNFKRKLCGF